MKQKKLPNQILRSFLKMIFYSFPFLAFEYTSLNYLNKYWIFNSNISEESFEPINNFFEALMYIIFPVFKVANYIGLLFALFCLIRLSILILRYLSNIKIKFV